MLGEMGTEQFTIETRQDGKLIRSQPIHDPFLHSKTTIAISRWDLFKAMFRKQFITTVEVSVSGSEGVQRAIMMLDPQTLAEETKAILEERRLYREHNTGSYNCFQAGEPAVLTEERHDET